jgi:hypothetical protein
MRFSGSESGVYALQGVLEDSHTVKPKTFLESLFVQVLLWMKKINFV